jgi:hypothetical protein
MGWKTINDLRERRESCNLLQNGMLDSLVSTTVCSWVFAVLDSFLPRLIPKGNFVRVEINIYADGKRPVRTIEQMSQRCQTACLRTDPRGGICLPVYKRDWPDATCLSICESDDT